MKVNLWKAIIFLACVLCYTTLSAQVETTPEIQPVFPKGSRVTNNNFTGTVYLQMLVQPDSLNPTSVGNVTFEAKARTNWHLHPTGQILLVTDGIGYYQERGQLKKIIRKGDVIRCTPNVPHWHGASNESGMTHLSMTISKAGGVIWMEPVKDDEYKK